jgi:hypothetical protein
VLTRIGSVEDFLAMLDEVEDELTAPTEVVVSDPLTAKRGDRLPHGFVVERVLGQGATALALLAKRAEKESVLKVALNEENNGRLHEEAEALRTIHSEFVVDIEEELEMGGRTVLVLQKAGDKTLSTQLRTEGVPALDLLERYGDDLLSAVTERFFDLTLSGTASSRAGYVGLIKDNAFMKRDFGMKLIQDFFPKVDLTHVLDASGVYLPGHGTPTTILFGRNRPPTAETVRAVRGIQGEPGTPDDPSKGIVWLSILKNIDIANGQDEFTSSADVSRSTFAVHPWSIGGGGAAELKERIDERSSAKVSDFAASVGIVSVAGEDDVLHLSSATGCNAVGGCS